MVVLDIFTKIIHFVHTVTIVTAYGVAELFMREIVKYHGIPEKIISDRDRRFVSVFWITLFQLCVTKIKLSSVYHHDTDGQTERTNKTFKDM